MGLERRLGECTDDFVIRLMDGAGFTPEEATAFVASALPALRESYAWQAEALEDAGLDSLSGIRWLLAGVRARTLASTAGLSPQRTWDGLRAMVPALSERKIAEEKPGDSPRGVAFGSDLPAIVHPVFGPVLRMREPHHS